MKHIRLTALLNAIFVTVCIVIQSCTKYDTPPPTADDGIKEVVTTTFPRKALWINIDGAVGKVIKEVMPPNIARILPHSKYSFDGLCDYRLLDSGQTEDPVTWTTMLTGVIPEKHFVVNHSYMPEIKVDVSDPDAQITYYPNMFYYINDALPGTKIFCVTPWQSLNNNLLNNTYKTVTSASDNEARDIALSSLADEEDYSFVVVGFNGMFEAGKTGGFTSSNRDYTAALNTIDGYIGEMLDVIEARSTYNNEDWLVVITSNHGGDAAGNYGGTSDEERNIFGIFYFAHYAQPKEMQAGTLTGMYFDSTISAKAYDYTRQYSIDANDTLTVELIARMIPLVTGSYNNGGSWGKWIGKSRWGVYRQHGNTSVRFTNDNGTASQTDIGSTYNNSLWHTYTVAIAPNEDTERIYSIYYDGGIKTLSKASGVKGTLTDTTDFVIGGNSAVKTSYYVAEVRLWDTLLTNPSDNASEVNITPSHPDYKHLIGYWKLEPGAVVDDTVIVSQIPGRPDMILSSPAKFVKFTNTLPKHREDNLIMDNTQIVPQILYWFNVSLPATLDGLTLLNAYAWDEEWREAVD